MLNPMTFNDAFSLVKIQKQYVWTSGKGLKSSFVDLPSQHVEGLAPMSNSQESILGNPKLPASARLPYKKILYAQIQERRRICLCYFCKEKLREGTECYI